MTTVHGAYDSSQPTILLHGIDVGTDSGVGVTLWHVQPAPALVAARVLLHGYKEGLNNGLVVDVNDGLIFDVNKSVQCVPPGRDVVSFINEEEDGVIAFHLFCTA